MVIGIAFAMFEVRSHYFCPLSGHRISNWASVTEKSREPSSPVCCISVKTLLARYFVHTEYSQVWISLKSDKSFGEECWNIAQEYLKIWRIMLVQILLTISSLPSDVQWQTGRYTFLQLFIPKQVFPQTLLIAFKFLSHGLQFKD